MRMLPIQTRSLLQRPSQLVFLCFLFLPMPVFAADLQDILENVRAVVHPLMGLVIIISYVAGIGMIFKGLGMLKAFGMPLTQASRPGEVAGPLVYICVGAILIYVPTATDIVSSTIFQGAPGFASIFGSGNQLNLQSMGKASDKLLGYAPVSVEGQWADMIDTIVLYVQFIGFIAFIRGWFIIAHSGQPGTQPGSISKGIVHIIGGILAVNFIPLVHIIHNTIFGTG